MPKLELYFSQMVRNKVLSASSYSSPFGCLKGNRNVLGLFLTSVWEIWGLTLSQYVGIVVSLGISSDAQLFIPPFFSLSSAFSTLHASPKKEHKGGRNGHYFPHSLIPGELNCLFSCMKCPRLLHGQQEQWRWPRGWMDQTEQNIFLFAWEAFKPPMQQAPTSCPVSFPSNYSFSQPVIQAYYIIHTVFDDPR